MLPECGAKISMPTVLAFEGDRLVNCSASVLGDYVDVATASAAARGLLSQISQQGLTYLDDKYARLATLDCHNTPNTTVPKNLQNERAIESSFLNAAYGLGSIIVFILHSGELLVDLRMTNMRRAFHNGSERDLRAQENRLSDAQRSAEKVYYLKITFYTMNVGFKTSPT